MVRSRLINLADTLSSDSFFDAQIEAIRQQTAVMDRANQKIVDAIGELHRDVQLLRDKLAD